ncbi:DUF1707 SHOCT-like domain-containing protein [Melissospora conviva]|uniref:DUF1707 SHOCT-like domain-containing protein n=1 Tax=Melissospora conviva TaxID=3388432 RepID=UPI003B81504C
MNYGMFRRAPFPQSDQRVGLAERTTVLQLLTRAFGEGYLQPGEYDARAAAVHGARTVGELMAPVADLPAGFRWAPPPAIPPPVAGVPVGGAVAPVVGVPVGAPPGSPAGGVSHGMAITSAVLGSISLVTSLCSWLGVAAGIAAVVLAIAPMRAKDSTARVGLVLGLVGITLSVLFSGLMFLIGDDPFSGSGGS